LTDQKKTKCRENSQEGSRRMGLSPAAAHQGSGRRKIGKHLVKMRIWTVCLFSC